MYASDGSRANGAYLGVEGVARMTEEKKETEWLAYIGAALVVLLFLCFVGLYLWYEWRDWKK